MFNELVLCLLLCYVPVTGMEQQAPVSPKDVVIIHVKPLYPEQQEKKIKHYEQNSPTSDSDKSEIEDKGNSERKAKLKLKTAIVALVTTVFAGGIALVVNFTGKCPK